MESLESLTKVDRMMLEKFGCYVKQKKPDFMILHSYLVTVGLEEKYHIPEIECTLEIPIDTMRNIAKRLVNLIKNGVHLKPDYLYDDVLVGYSVEFKKTTHSQRLRIILPDKCGFFPNDPLCDSEFKSQYFGIVS